MNIDDFLKLPDDEKEAVKEACILMAFDWVCDRHTNESEKFKIDMAEDIWGDFLHEVED